MLGRITQDVRHCLDIMAIKDGLISIAVTSGTLGVPPTAGLRIIWTIRGWFRLEKTFTIKFNRWPHLLSPSGDLSLRATSTHPLNISREGTPSVPSCLIPMLDGPFHEEILNIQYKPPRHNWRQLPCALHPDVVGGLPLSCTCMQRGARGAEWVSTKQAQLLHDIKDTSGSGRTVLVQKEEHQLGTWGSGHGQHFCQRQLLDTLFLVISTTRSVMCFTCEMNSSKLTHNIEEKPDGI